MVMTTTQALESLYSPAELTILAQALPVDDTGEALLWDTFFPRQDVPGVELNSVTTLDYRPASDRREWNARGRILPRKAPPRRRVSIVPIEIRDTIDEKEMQGMAEAAGGNWALIAGVIGETLPARVDAMQRANFRRLELDAFTAWTAGNIVQRNPETGSTYTASFGFSSSRYTTAGTAWNDAGVNAYDLLLAWVAAAEQLVGRVEGVMLRLATMNAILADAPNLPNSVKMTRSMLADRISEDMNEPFAFYVNENSVDYFADGGIAETRVKVWPANTIAAIPRGRTIGRTAFAPVVRAMEYAGQVGTGPGGVDVRGNTVYYEAANGGRELMVECQLNAIPIPDEGRIFVTNVGV